MSVRARKSSCCFVGKLSANAILSEHTMRQFKMYSHSVIERCKQWWWNVQQATDFRSFKPNPRSRCKWIDWRRRGRQVEMNRRRVPSGRKLNNRCVESWLHFVCSNLKLADMRLEARACDWAIFQQEVRGVADRQEGKEKHEAGVARLLFYLKKTLLLGIDTFTILHCDYARKNVFFRITDISMIHCSKIIWITVLVKLLRRWFPNTINRTPHTLLK